MQCTNTRLCRVMIRLFCVKQRNGLYEFLLASNPIYREPHHFQQESAPCYLLDLISWAAPSTLHSDPICCVGWSLFSFFFFFFFLEAWFGWWDVAAIQKAFYFLLALNNGGKVGCVREKAKEWWDGEMRTSSFFLGHEWLQKGGSWFHILQQITLLKM